MGFRQFILNRKRMKANLKMKELEAEQLHELEETRSRFFANISHEFRTPLTLILGPLEILRGSDAEEPHQSLYLIMEKNARRLLHLINQLLELSKLDSRTPKLEPQPQNLDSFFRTLAYSFHSLAESKEIIFEAQLEEIDHVFFFDGDRLEKIGGNLISKALEFTADGGHVKVTVSFQGEGENKEGTLIMRISDNGTGIAKEEIERIFDRIYQVDSSKTRKHGGTGLGLALVKELVDLHKGTIDVESEVDIGTTFTVKLPMARGQTKEELPTVNIQAAGWGAPFFDEQQLQGVGFNQKDPSSTPLSEEKPRLLIVEDNKDLASFVALQFQSQYETKTAYNGKRGLQIALETVPDVIISDVMMPEMDGIRLCEILKTDDRTSHIPVILLTAKAAEKEKLEGLETGADDYLTKPFSGPELRVRVHNLYEGRKRLRERFSREVTLQPKNMAITSADEKFLERILAIIEANYMEPTFNADYIEKEAGLSRTQLYRKLKALSDQAPGEFLRNFRLQKAAMFLESGQGNITEVAYGVGFNSLAYFTRCFHNVYLLCRATLR